MNRTKYCTPVLSLLLAVLAPATQAQEAARVDALPGGVVIDLSHPYDEHTVYWPTADGFKMTIDFRGETPGGWHYESNSIRTSEHGGTHLDAPIHFAADRQHTDEIPLDRLIGPAVLVDVRPQAEADPDYLVSVADFQAWEARHGRLPDGVTVLIRTGFGSRWPDAENYLGTAERGAAAVAKLHFPGLDPAAARWLVTERDIHAIGLDTASIDRGQSQDFLAHRILFESNIPAFENLARLDRLPARDFSVIALPMKIRGGSGGPLRIVAIVP